MHYVIVCDVSTARLASNTFAKGCIINELMFVAVVTKVTLNILLYSLSSIAI